MMADKNCKLLVIGAGPGGYVCAIKAAQLGVDTIIVESAAPGGTCLNVGCIPSKAIIHAADEFYKMVAAQHGSPIGIKAGAPEIDLADTLRWKDGIVDKLNNGVRGLLKKSGAQWVVGVAEFIDGKTVRVTNEQGTQTISCEHVVIATGAKAVELPSLPFGGDIISSTQALSLQHIPKSLAVVGGGYIGLELGSAFAKLGSQVVVIEAAQSVLLQYDNDLVRPVIKRLADLGVEVITNTTVTGVEGNQLQLQKADGEHLSVSASKILVTVGRSPETGSCSVNELQLTMNGRYIQIDQRCHRRTDACTSCYGAGADGG